MHNWREGRIGELATGVRGVSYRPDQLRELLDSATVALIRATNIQNGKIDLTDLQIVPKSIVASEQFLRDGDVAVCMSNGSKALVGKSAQLICDRPFSLTVGAFCSVFHPLPNTYSRFVGYAFQSDSFRRNIDVALAGSTINNLRNSALEAFPLLIPPEDEQRRIAAVMNAVDTAIESTRAAIAKLKQLRTGLLHDLLTHGLDDNGELRDPFKHPEQFKQSTLGEIPKDWAVETLRGCLLDNPQNGLYKPARQIGRGALLIGQTSINDDRSIDVSMVRRVEVTSAEIRRYHLVDGDILISRVFATLEGVGQPALVPVLMEPAMYESNMMRLQVNRSRVVPRLLFELLRHPFTRARIISAAHLSNQASINQAGLNPIPLALPQDYEQREIVRRIDAQEMAIAVLAESERNQRQLRAGVMSDLLNGRISVPEALDTGV